MALPYFTTWKGIRMANFDADILGRLNESIDSLSNRSATEINYLRSVDDSLKMLLQQSRNVSQANARSSLAGDRSGSSYLSSVSGFSRHSYGRRGGKFEQFTDAFEKELLKGLLGSDFKSNIEAALSTFAKDLGVELEDIPNEMGKQLGEQAINAFKDSKFGKDLTSKIQGSIGNFFGDIRTNYISGKTNFSRTASGAAAGTAARAGAGAAAGQAAGAAGAAAGARAAAGSSSAAMAGFTKAAGGAARTLAKAVPVLGIVVIALTLLTKAISPLIEGFKKLGAGMKQAANRENASREKNLKLAQERMEADVRAMIEGPFNILQDAAQLVYNTWDANLRAINATQGYTKADLQTLMANFTDRLREDGLSNVLGSTNIVDSLTRVLESGLSGAAAEEFAYLATILNAAVPTQDFFSYADDYTQIAANLIRQGKSEAEAMAFANQTVQQFASNVLYASRTLSGGFTTGLQNAESLLTSAIQIQQAARSGDVGNISGVLTSVAAITGGIAPALTTAVTDLIVKAATGGNSSDIVALRSLAGTGASNTEFLKAFAENPQDVFVRIFDKLAGYQNMAPGAYMEVAEGISDVFGMTMDTFAQVDFAYLADQISRMSVNTASLSENIAHLASGETTTNAEMLRMQQVNQYMIDEGLAYVLDNEVARSIQENMWAEQRQRELLEATYAVELKGAALEFLEGIRKTIDNILSFLNPLSWFKKPANLIGTALEVGALEKDIKQVLELGKVGQGNAKALSQLITRNHDLNLVPNYVEMLGGKSKYESTSNIRRGIQYAMTPWNFIWDGVRTLPHTLTSIFSSFGGGDTGSASSIYNWGNLGRKSTAAALSSVPFNSEFYSSNAQLAKSGSSVAKAAATGNFNSMLDQLDTYFDPSHTNYGSSYSDWRSSASKFGVTDFDTSIAAAGYTENDLMDYFQQRQIEAGTEMEATFRKMQTDYMTKVGLGEGNILELTTIGNSLMTQLLDQFTKFHKDWTSYYIEHAFYYSDTLRSNIAEVQRIQTEQKDGSKDAVYALADALTQNNVDLLNPAVQTNALLSAILQVVNAIMQQNNSTVALTLPDALGALALGMTEQAVR